ncbi:MAG: hypothetical protein HKN09_01005 [Saprospiraceae bacterium]|nr:hypothetical protein [Saprospiraceae bacterium]
MKTLLLLASCLISFQFIGAQNDATISAYDDEDIEFLFNSVGLEVFKFPFTSESNESLNIIIQEYKNGKKVQEIDLYQQFLPMFKVLNQPAKDFFKPLDGTNPSWVKFYIDTNKNELVSTVRTGKIEKKYTFDISGLKFSQSRSFDYVKTEIDERMPLFTFYGINDGKLLVFPGNAKVKDVLPLYSHVIVFYAEPFMIF